MARRKPPPPPPVPITYSEEWQAPSGRHVRRGTELRIHGLPGRYRFMHHASAPRGEWVTVVGPLTGRKEDAPLIRSFLPQRVRTVHRERMARPAE